MFPMITTEDIDSAVPIPLPPSPGPWVVTDDGKIVPCNSHNPELDYIADVSIAPNGPRNIHVICASSMMLRALKAIRRDPAAYRLNKQALELMEEALTAAE